MVFTLSPPPWTPQQIVTQLSLKTKNTTVPYILPSDNADLILYGKIIFQAAHNSSQAKILSFFFYIKL